MTPIVRLIWFAASVVVGLLLVALWQVIADLRLVSPVFLPGPDRVWKAMIDGFARGDLLLQMLSTIQQMIYGWLLASFLGVALGALIGSWQFENGQGLSRPKSQIPQALASIGRGPGGDLFLRLVKHNGIGRHSLRHPVADAAGDDPWFFRARASPHRVQSRPEDKPASNDLEDSAAERAARHSGRDAVCAHHRIDIVRSMRNAGQSKRAGTRHSVGGARAFRSADLFAGVILLGLIGFVSNLLISVIEQRLLRWRRQS